MKLASGFQIARIGGIPIRAHVSFLAILPFLAWAFSRSFPLAVRLAGVPDGALAGPAWLWGLGLAFALFLSVLVHELAHSLYAIAKGGQVRAITLLMIGGVSEITEPPRTHGQEAMMAFVGPATSLGLGVLALGGWVAVRPLGAWPVSFVLFQLAYLNVFLAAFNLLPAFPMDGGRVLRGLLARRLGLVRATEIAAGVGKLFAIGFAVWGFTSGNLLLALVALFVYLGAERESRDVAIRGTLEELPIRDLVTPDPASVAPHEPVFEVAERMLRERRLGYPVVEGDRIVGLVTLEALDAVPAHERMRTRVRQAMRSPPVLGPDDRAADALRVLDREGVHQLAVAEGGLLLGLLSRFDIMRGLRLRELARSQRGRARWRHGRATA